MPDPPPRRWPWATAGLVLGLLAGTLFGALAWSSTTVVAAPPIERTVVVTAPAPPAEVVTVTAPAPPPPADTGLLTAFGDGVWEVGVDIAPGKYKTAGTDAYGCYYARLKANDGTVDDIISNGFGQGPVTVTVKPDDGYFETSGCSGWTRAA